MLPTRLLPGLDRLALGAVKPINERSTHARLRDPSSRVAGKTFRGIPPLRALRSRPSTDLHRLIQNVLSYFAPGAKAPELFSALYGTSELVPSRI